MVQFNGVLSMRQAANEKTTAEFRSGDSAFSVGLISPAHCCGQYRLAAWVRESRMRRLAVPSMLALVWLCSCSSADAPALRVGSNVWPGYELLHVADNIEYYEDARVRVIEFPSTFETIRSYRGGAIDGQFVMSAKR
jgi:hypothetical protein